MSKIKKYNKFIKESKLDVEKMELFDKSDDTFISNMLSLRVSFFNTLGEIFDDYKTKYFSDLCKIKDADTLSDFNNMQAKVSGFGWDIESIKNLFSDRSNRACGFNFIEFVNGLDKGNEKFDEAVSKVTSNADLYKDLFKKRYGHNSYTPLDEFCGMCDIYCYFLAKELGEDYNKIALGGEGWSDLGLDNEEFVIRYGYGYHNTPYGKLMIEQMGMTYKEFLEKSVESIKSIVSIELPNAILRAYSRSNRMITSRMEKLREINRIVDANLNIFIVIEDDKVYIDYLMISDMFEDRNISLELKELSSEIVSTLDSIGLGARVSASDIEVNII